MTYTTLVSPQQLRALVDDGTALVVDCGFDLAEPQAGRQAYRSGHIPGAQYLHLDDDLAAPAGAQGRHPLPDPAVFAETLRRIGLRDGQQVIAYDAAGGAFAARLWWLLRWLGHDAVAVLDGGRQAWSAAGYGLERTQTDATAGDFTPHGPDAQRVLDVDAVVANLASQTFLVFDARTAERFAGQPNPLDPVAGHIPDARNRFFKDNLDEDGRFCPTADLAAAFASVLDGVAPDRVVLQCGSGVTACHNALAMEIAGLPGARLYPGSWSEWINDPGRPVATSLD